MDTNCNHDCSACDERQPDPKDFIKTPHELSDIRKVIGVMSGKGGVGKSSVTAMLAVLAQRAGYRTAILDADITGPSIPKMIKPAEEIGAAEDALYPAKSSSGIELMSINLLLDKETTPVIYRGPIIAQTVEEFWTNVIWGDIDIMFIDMPPGTGDVPLSVFQSIPLDGIILTTSPQELVTMIVGKAVTMAQIMNIPVLGIVENMSYVECPCCGAKIEVFGRSRVDELAAQYNIDYTAQIPFNSKIAAGCDSGNMELFEGSWLDRMLQVIMA